MERRQEKLHPHPIATWPFTESDDRLVQASHLAIVSNY
jgi:hypothetical protein